jgi:hypothetical protein
MNAIRRMVTRAARRVDHTLGRLGSSRRILIEVRTPMNLVVLAPIWRRLRADSRIDLLFTAEQRDEVARVLEDEGLAHALVEGAAVAWRRLDLSITADAWNTAPLRRCLHRVKFFHGVAGKYDLDAPSRLGAAELDAYDRIAFINEDRMRRYLAAGVIRREQAALVGFPKIDDLVNGAWPAADVRRSLGLAADVPTVIYAPTFSTASSLHLAGEEIISALLADGRNVIVKLHDRSLVPSEKHTAGIDWPARLARFSGQRGFAFARGSDSSPYLSAADALVTDHSTVGFEFALLDRPVVVFNAPELREAARIDAEKWALLRSMGDVVDTPADVAAAVTRALARPERLRDARRQAHTLFAHAGTATERALALVYELLELAPAPAAIPESRTAAGAHAAA